MTEPRAPAVVPHRREAATDAIRRLVADLERAFNRHDAADLDRHFTDDAIWANVLGERLSGRRQIDEAHARLLAGPLRDAHARYAVEEVAFVRPDVAVAHVRQHPTGPDGTPVEGGQSSLALYVLVEERGAWWIAAGQNTLVRAPGPGPS